MLKLKTILLDLLRCIKLSSLLGGLFVLLSGLLSAILSKGHIMSILESMRGILFVIGSLGLLIGAIMLLKKRSEAKPDAMCSCHTQAPEWRWWLLQLQHSPRSAGEASDSQYRRGSTAVAS